MDVGEAGDVQRDRDDVSRARTCSCTCHCTRHAHGILFHACARHGTCVHGGFTADLDDVKQVGLECKVTHDHLCGVAESGVEEPSQRIVGVQRNLFGGLAQHAGERQDGEAGDTEDRRVGPLEVLGQEGQGHEGEQEVPAICKRSGTSPRSWHPSGER